MKRVLVLTIGAWLLAHATPAAAAPRALPGGLASSIDAADRPLTSIVVADIDADGDADVVATDEALNLFVWINDGTGRLTRQRPAPARPASTDGARPGVERGVPAPPPTVPPDPPALDARLSPSDAVALAWTGVARLTPRARRDLPRAARRLRGPPSALPQL